MNTQNNKNITTIIDYGYDGEGVAKTDGKICFIPYTIKGEVVEYEILKDSKSFSSCKLLNVIKKSKLRTKPECKYFAKCGGCAYQHMSYENELKIKQSLLAKQLKKVAFNGNITLYSSPKKYNYRNKIKLFVDESNIGLKYRASNKICSIEACPLAKENINHAIKIVKNYIRENYLNKNILNIIIRQEKDSCLINFIVKEKIEDFHYQKMQSLLNENFGIYQTIGKTVLHKAGLKSIITDEFGLKCIFLPLSFHQVNNEVCNELYQNVLDEIEGKYIINCYSGNGVLSGILAKNGCNVIGIELGENEHLEAEKLKDINHLKNLNNIHGDCEKVLFKLKSCDTLIVDPPRTGLSKKVINSINNMKTSKLIYISCNSATLVRDLQRLQGYEITKVKLFDMFARTGEYETLVILKKIKN